MKKYLAEFIGMFALVFCGTGAIIVNEQSNGALDLVGITFAFGIIVSAMIYIFGNISGAHINPSVTIALVTGKLISIKKRNFIFSHKFWEQYWQVFYLKLCFQKT